jgi:hypothetical protein
MGKSKKTTQANPKLNGKVSIKWVKKAQQWVKTTFENGKQKQEWSNDEPR